MTALQHVALEIRRDDVPAAVAFWGLLGFDPVPAPGALADRTTWVGREGSQIHLMHREEPVVPPSGHPAVVLADYEAACARLREAGFEVAPREEHWGAPRAFVASPGGHRVEVMAAPPV